jgi:hypothetical protein
MHLPLDPSELPALQREVLEDLASVFASVGVRGTGTHSVYMDCYEQQPDACSACGTHQDDHEDGIWDHDYRVPVPVKTYRVMPSGFKLDITPSGGVRPTTARGQR